MVVPWCGLLFDSRRVLSLRGDYGRFTNIPNITDTLTIRRVVGNLPLPRKFRELLDPDERLDRTSLRLSSRSHAASIPAF